MAKAPLAKGPPPTPAQEIEERGWINQRATDQALRAAKARQMSGRRRYVDPTTCERDYSTAEIEFMNAMQEYKMRSGRMFPTWSEILEVLSSLGYEKPPGQQGMVAAAPVMATSRGAVQLHP
ncbi:MAG TPA: hypothetical protein VGY53_08065 [Isosphaeraceae bacterium]|jgi:hypothetical protein|nr:hypothetical protein [Isosphaeraceae bacterium]